MSNNTTNLDISTTLEISTTPNCQIYIKYIAIKSDNQLSQRCKVSYISQMNQEKQMSAHFDYISCKIRLQYQCLNSKDYKL